MSHGEKINRSVKTRPSSDTKAYCRAVKWLDKNQRKLCYHFPEMIEIIGKGVKHALKECRRQFSSHRWNCSTLDWEQVFTEGGILRKRKCVLDFIRLYTH